MMGHLAEAGGECDGLLGGGELRGVGVPGVTRRRHGARGEEWAAGTEARRGCGGGGAAAGGEEGRRRRIREAGPRQCEGSGGGRGGGQEDRVLEEAHARSDVTGAAGLCVTAVGGGRRGRRKVCTNEPTDKTLARPEAHVGSFS